MISEFYSSNDAQAITTKRPSVYRISTSVDDSPFLFFEYDPDRGRQVRSNLSRVLQLPTRSSLPLKNTGILPIVLFQAWRGPSSGAASTLSVVVLGPPLLPAATSPETLPEAWQEPGEASTRTA